MIDANVKTSEEVEKESAEEPEDDRTILRLTIRIENGMFHANLKASHPDLLSESLSGELQAYVMAVIQESLNEAKAKLAKEREDPAPCPRCQGTGGRHAIVPGGIGFIRCDCQAERVVN